MYRLKHNPARFTVVAQPSFEKSVEDKEKVHCGINSKSKYILEFKTIYSLI